MVPRLTIDPQMADKRVNCNLATPVYILYPGVSNPVSVSCVIKSLGSDGEDRVVTLPL